MVENTDYYSLSRPDVQNLVSLESKIILDVGCGEGKMASELKKRNNAEVWGIEIVKTVAEKAIEKLDKVFTGRVGDNIIELPEKYIEKVISLDANNGIAKSILRYIEEQNEKAAIYYV